MICESFPFMSLSKVNPHILIEVLGHSRLLLDLKSRKLDLHVRICRGFQIDLLFKLHPRNKVLLLPFSDQTSPKPLLPEEPNLLHDYSRQQSQPNQDNSDDTR